MVSRMRAWQSVRQQKLEGGEVRIIGPAAPAVAKIKDIYRRVIYLKAGKEADAGKAKDQMEEFAKDVALSVNFKIYFDLNPIRTG